ncbi:MAG: hypothetical protein GEU77_19135 [Deltaproteobacteria bacterium]|nr:hypothetical protein [Deltaproteobacteria bacterium]
MARPLRIEYPGAYYHVTSRGNERKAIFRDDQDRQKFLELLGRAVGEFQLRLHCYVLMDNHYHLLVETPKAGLNRALRYLNGVYTQTFNRRHQRVGHLFQGRYQAILVDKESYLLQLSRYVHLNPWRMKDSRDPFTYRWSSQAAYVGSAACPRWLTVTEVLSYFGKKGKRGYRDFIVDGTRNGITTPWENVTGQVVIGSPEFVQDVVRNHLPDSENKRGEESQVRQLTGMKPDTVMREAQGYFGVTRDEIRDRGQRYTDARYVTSYLLRRHCLMTLQEIGAVVGLHYSAAGNAIRQMRDQPTESQAKSLRELERKFKNQ